MSDPVADGREALNPWFGYPWYDAKTDGIRRVEPPQEQSFSLASPFDLSTEALQWAAWVAIGLALAAVVYLLARAYRRHWSHDALDEAESIGEVDRVEALPIPAASTRTDLLAEARECYERGDFGRAMIFFFSHQLVQLDQRHIVRLARGKTNRQYLREVGPRVALRDLVEQTMTAFEDSYFGGHAIDRKRFESCWQRLPEFESLLEASP